MTVHTRESIRSLLARSNSAVERGVMVLFARQTGDEQAHGMTSVSNGIGVGYAHAAALKRFAEWIGKGNPLTGKHLEYARKMVARYAGQLAAVANAKAQAGMTDREMDAAVVAAEQAAERAAYETKMRRDAAEAYRNKEIGTWA